MAMNNEILTIQEAADFLRVSDDTIRRRLKDDPSALPGRQIGRQWRFSKRALLRWVEGYDEPPTQYANQIGNAQTAS